MKCVLIVLLSIISCQSRGSDGGQEETGNDYGYPNFPLRLTQASSWENEKPEMNSGQQHDQDASSYQLPNSATTSVPSRIVDTKYGKLQGLVMTLLPGPSQNQKTLHPLRNKIVEVRSLQTLNCYKMI